MTIILYAFFYCQNNTKNSFTVIVQLSLIQIVNKNTLQVVIKMTNMLLLIFEYLKTAFLKTIKMNKF